MVKKLLSFICLFIIMVELSLGLDQWSGQAPRLTSLVDFDTLDYVVSLHNKPHINRWKCLGPLGCFYNGPPYFHPKLRPISLLPYDRDRLKVRSLYYSRKNTGQSQILRWEQTQSLTDSFFDPNLKTKIIIHGLFDMLRFTPWIMQMKNELLLKGEYNVIVIDWTKGNRFPYEQAVANTRAVAVEVALLIKALTKHCGLRVETLHLIGHSLGAHLAGYVGSLIPGIARISGLDPAGVYYQGTDREVRLDYTDALFVDVIHSDASNFALVGIGTLDLSGHVDFFPNGGTIQPGCLDDLRAETFLLIGLLPGSRTTVACDHERSISYYLESVNNPFCQAVGLSSNVCKDYEDFEDAKCGDCGPEGQNCLIMGYHSDRYWNSSQFDQPKGYFLKTASKEPFCVYQYHVTLEVNSNSNNSIGKAFLLFQSENNESGIKIQLTSRVQKMSPGHTYSFLITSQGDLQHYTEIIFSWKSHQYSSSRIWIDNFTISPIHIYKRQLRTFCPPSNHTNYTSNVQVLREDLC